MMALEEALGMAIAELAAEVAIQKAMDIIEDDDSSETSVSRADVVRKAIRDGDERQLVSELTKEEQEELYAALERAAVMNRGSSTVRTTR